MAARRPNPSAYLDARGVAHVQMAEQQEGFGAPRRSTLMHGLGISGQAADRLREKMRRADETGDGIEEILREAQRLLRAKGVAYYPGAADAPNAPDGIAFVDRGDPKAETLLYDHRDGRFTVNAWGPAVARQRERFSKNNPDPAKRYRDLQRMAAPGSGASENERAMAQRLLAKMTPPPEERPTPRSGAYTGGYSYSPPRRQPEPWQTDPRDSTEIYRNDLSDLNFAKKSIYEHASAPRVRVTLHGFDGTYGRSMLTAFSSLDDLGYAAEVLEAWGEPYFKKNGVFDAVIGMVEGESDARVLRIRGEDVSDLGLTLDHDSFNLNPFNDSSFGRRLRALVEAHTGAPMPTQFVTNPRRNPRPRVTPRPSEKTLASALDISLNQAAGLRRFMYIRSPEKILQDTNTVIRGPGFDYSPSEQDTPSEQKGISALLGDWSSPTLIYDHAKEKYVVAAFGDYVRANRSRFGALADTYDHIAPRKNPSPRPSVTTLARAGFSRTQANDLRDKMDGLSVFTVLKAADKMLDGHGVEYIESLTDTSRSREGLSYVNMGDTYETTLIYDHRSGRFVVSSWGDIVERDAKRFGY